MIATYSKLQNWIKTAAAINIVLMNAFNEFTTLKFIEIMIKTEIIIYNIDVSI